MKKTLMATLVASTLLMTACKDDTQTSAKDLGRFETTGEVVATVNGVDITQTQLDEYLKYRAQSQQPTIAPVDELVNLEILRQAALAAGTQDDQEARAAMTRAAADALANVYVKKAVSTEISDEDLKAEYDEQVAKVKESLKDEKEYNASHILVETEEEAKAIIAAIKDGADFAEQAKEKSIGPSGPSGGSLSWAPAETYVPEFSAAMIALEPGSVSDAPVQTQFGWHIIKLHEVRAAEAPAVPPFEQVKDRLNNVVLQKRMATFMEDLREKADIKVKEDKPAEEAAPAEETAG